MAERGMLHICHLDSFAAYLQGLGYEKQPLSHSLYEVLRMKKGKDTVLVFRRNAAKEHLSVMDKDIHLVRAFFREGGRHNG